ncbi:hypothetical protein ACROYT_G014767 [Oculina patagonica]
MDSDSMSSDEDLQVIYEEIASTPDLVEILSDDDDNDDDDRQLEENQVDVSHSPRKFRREEIVSFRGNEDCKVVKLESLENPFGVPLLMNCKKDNKELVSSSVPHAIQENGTFLVDLDKLANRKDVFADDNGVWIMKGSRRKSYCVEKDADGQVISLNRSQGNTDIIVRRRPYANSTQSYVRTKESTKEKLAKNVADVKFNTKRALFQTVKEVGGVSGAASTSSLPRNYTQAKNIKQKLGLTPGSSTKSANDPLLAVLELQKSTFPGFIREVVCNDLPTIMLYTDSQLDNIVKFCCNDKAGLVSELGLDITFQLGPFYVLVSTYKNTLLNVKGSNHSPSCMGPIMICMTKEEATYLSFLHCLLREVPGLSQYLHATGTDNEVALRNATAAGFPNASALLCYLHSKRNVKAKLKELGVSHYSGQIPESNLTSE